MKTTEQAVLELQQTQQEALIGRWGLQETGLKHINCPFCGKRNKQGDGCRINYTSKLGGQPQYASICAGCGPKGIISMLIAAGATMPEINREIGFKYGEDKPASAPNIATRETRLIDTFKAARPVREFDHAKEYFYARGIQVIPAFMVRFHPKLNYRNNRGQVIGQYDAFVSCATNALGRPAYMHVTWIDDAKKVELGDDNPARKQFSLVPDGLKPRCSIKFKNRSPTVQAVAEGIESALAYEEIYKTPTDACLNAGLLANYRPPEYVEELHIAYDNDHKWAGQSAAHQLKHSVACQCPWVKKIIMRGPDESGNDFNNVLVEGVGVDTTEWNR